MPEISEHEAVAAIMEKIDAATPEPQDAIAPETVSEETGASTAEPGSTDPDEAEPLTPAVIEPPPNWKAELKAKWADLSPDLQQAFVQQETERNQGFNAKLEESAKESKAAKAEREALATERLKYEQALGNIIQQSVARDPILAQAAQTDWVEMWDVDPAGAGKLRAQVEARINELQALEQERQRVATERLSTVQSEAQKKLAEQIPEWQDDAKRKDLTSKLTKYLTEKEGFKPEELQMVLDPRHVTVARKAMLYDELMAAKQTVKAKQVNAVPTRPLRAAAPQDVQTAESQRAKAAKSRFQHTGKETDREAAALAIIGAR